MTMTNVHVLQPSDTEIAQYVIHVLGDQLSYGATFQTNDLRRIARLDADNQETHLRWLSVCQVLKRILLDGRLMYLRSNGSGSYTIVTPEEQAAVAAGDEAGKISRAINDAESITEHTDTDRLSADQLARHDNIKADRASRADVFRRELRKRWRD